jgi:hypothetical protein
VKEGVSDAAVVRSRERERGQEVKREKERERERERGRGECVIARKLHSERSENRSTE